VGNTWYRIAHVRGSSQLVWEGDFWDYPICKSCLALKTAGVTMGSTPISYFAQRVLRECAFFINFSNLIVFYRVLAIVGKHGSESVRIVHMRQQVNKSTLGISNVSRKDY